MATVFETEAARAQTWVLTLTKATPLNMDTMRGWALTNQALFGMHIASGTMIISITKPETQQNMLNKLRTLIEHAGGDRTALAAVKPLDTFHMELWGCIEPYKAPKQPHVEVADFVSIPTESEDEEPPAENKEPELEAEEAIVVYNDRELAVKFEQVAALKPAAMGRPAVITLDDAERQLDSDLADLTADEKRHLTILYRPEMLRATAEHIAEECANLPPMETIHWLTRRPEPLVVYKHMPAQRKLQWLLHRARDAEMEKTPATWLPLQTTRAG
jgi:hypothetical protein